MFYLAIIACPTGVYTYMLMYVSSLVLSYFNRTCASLLLVSDRNEISERGQNSKKVFCIVLLHIFFFFFFCLFSVFTVSHVSLLNVDCTHIGLR